MDLSAIVMLIFAFVVIFGGLYITIGKAMRYRKAKRGINNGKNSPDLLVRAFLVFVN